jgi:hypothetical protein
MKKVYAIFLADSLGNFDWVLTVPKPIYQSKEEAEQVREQLIQTEPTVTLENSKVVELYQMEQNKKLN